MNCSMCYQIVGINNDDKWIYYTMVRNQRQEREYICLECSTDTHFIWTCIICNEIKNIESKFCHTGYDKYCESCLISFYNETNINSICYCKLCQNIIKNMIQLK